MVGYIQAYHFCCMEIADTFIPTAGTVGVLPMIVYFLMQVAMLLFLIGFIAALGLPQIGFAEPKDVFSRTSLLLTAMRMAVAGLVYYQLQAYYQHFLVELATTTDPADRQTLSREAYNAIGQFRYVAWFITMPMVLIQAFILLKPGGGRTYQQPALRLVAAILFLFLASYIGHQQLSFDNEVLTGYKLTWGLIALIDYVFIGFTLVRIWKTLNPVNSVPEKAFGFITRGLLGVLGVYVLGYFLTLVPFDHNWLHLLFTVTDVACMLGVGSVAYWVSLTQKA